ncbi:MAG: transcriptional repressor LexA [Pseudomonadota bacterium]
MLTPKQHDLLMFIHERLEQSGVSPSFDEMKDALGLRSKSGIHRLITALEERGFIRRLAHRARALEVIKLPDVYNTKKADNVIVGPFRLKRQEERTEVDIPLHGKIAAGTPIEALEDVDRFVSVPPSMIGKGSHYALEVSGESMVEAGILDGDVVLIERCEAARDGEIVVALVDDNEATLKTLRKRGPDILLEPSNRDYQTQVLPADRVRIQGRLAGLMRRY